MKKTITLNILIFVVCSAFNTSKKTFTDYRDVYVGTYFCRSNCSGHNASMTENVLRSDTASIKIIKDVLDSILLVNINQHIFKLKLVNKSLRAFSGSYCGGKFFATDSLDFGFSAGHISSCRYKGKKK